MKPNHAAIVITYAGLQLQISKNDKGEDITPLKPISDLFGLKWQDQRKKITESPFLMRRFGISWGDILTSNANSGMDIHTSNTKNPTYLAEIFIRLDRVAAYLMTISPDRVRAAGNLTGADYLEQKISEWDDALHDYEELGCAINLSRLKERELRRKETLALTTVINLRTKTAAPNDRQLLGQVIGNWASELGLQYQPDLAGV